MPARFTTLSTIWLPNRRTAYNLTTDDYKTYLNAMEDTFGSNIDYECS